MSAGFYERPEVAGWLLRLPVFAGEELLLDALGDGRGRVAVDVGSGAGRLCAAVRRRGYAYRAADPSHTQVASLRRAHPGVPAVVACGAELPWADESADLALLAFHVIEAIAPRSRRLATLRETRRVLRPGGTLLLSHHRRWRYRPLSQLRHRLTAAGGELGDLVLRGGTRTGGVDATGVPMHIPGGTELRRLARQAGFRPVRAVPLKKPGGPIATLLAVDVFRQWEAV